MLRSNHVLSLALLISAPAFAMEDSKALVAANQEVAPSAALLSTITLAENHKSEVSTLGTLTQQEIVLADAKKAKAQEVSALTAQLAAKLASKNKQIEGSATTIKTFQDELAKLKVDAPLKKAAFDAELAKQEADLAEKISKEEKAKKALETEAAQINDQINPKVEGPAAAPKAWYRFGF